MIPILLIALIAPAGGGEPEINVIVNETARFDAGIWSADVAGTSLSVTLSATILPSTLGIVYPAILPEPGVALVSSSTWASGDEVFISATLSGSWDVGDPLFRLLGVCNAAEPVTWTAASGGSATWEWSDVQRGDVDGSGTVNIADAIALLAANLGPCVDAADANDDGAVDIADAVVILDAVFQGWELQPCGVDLTLDFLNCDGGVCP